MIDQVRELITVAKYITVLTGAGISTDSGIPDFRGPNGIWTKNPEAEALTNITNYIENAEMRQKSWDLYMSDDWDQYEPNKGHLAVKSLYDQGKLTGCVTQNIDGLHSKAGVPAEFIHELHGNLTSACCTDCHRYTEKKNANKKCGYCGGINKPNLIFFGELLNPIVWFKAVTAVENCELLIVAGTSLMVAPASELPIQAHHDRIPVVFINNDPPPVYMEEFIDVTILGSISEILPKLVEPNGLKI